MHHAPNTAFGLGLPRTSYSHARIRKSAWIGCHCHGFSSGAVCISSDLIWVPCPRFVGMLVEDRRQTRMPTAAVGMAPIGNKFAVHLNSLLDVGIAHPHAMNVDQNGQKRRQIYQVTDQQHGDEDRGQLAYGHVERASPGPATY